MCAEQHIAKAVGASLLYTNITVPGLGARPFVLLPKDGDPSTLVLWVSQTDEHECKFVEAVRELAWQILWDAAKLDERVVRLLLRFD